VRSGSLPLEISPKLENSLSELSATLAAWLKSQSSLDSRNGSTNSSSKNQTQTKSANTSRNVFS
jgi:hypothetical protein